MVVEALEDAVGGRRGEGLAEAPEEERAYRVLKTRAHLEEGEELRRGEGLEDYGEDLAVVKHVYDLWVRVGSGWGRTSLGRAAKELGGSSGFGMAGADAAAGEGSGRWLNWDARMSMGDGNVASWIHSSAGMTSDGGCGSGDGTVFQAPVGGSASHLLRRLAGRCLPDAGKVLREGKGASCPQNASVVRFFLLTSPQLCTWSTLHQP